MDVESRQIGATGGQQKEKRILAAFDFDYTVVQHNTDTVARDLLLNKIPKNLSSIIESAGWTEYMAEIFRLLHKNNIGPSRINEAIRCIPEVPGFVRLLKRLEQKSCDLIIISDSNSVFIEEWLRAHRLLKSFTSVFTNPAYYDNGLLCIKPYHQSDCHMSAPNLCKGKVLERFLVEQDLRHNRLYDKVIYVGDGNNDFCPVLRCLRSSDYACARQGYSLEKSIEKNRHKLKVQNVLSWINGFDLLKQLEMGIPQLADDTTQA